MLLIELFADDGDDVEGGDVIQRLRDDIVDALVPLAANGVPYVTIDKIIDKMREKRTGFEITKELVFQVLDPDKVKIINRLEGDRVYFSMPKEEEREVGQDQKVKDAEHTAQKASDQAKKNIAQ